jgi:DNA-binding transcriptional LysR family regulator
VLAEESRRIIHISERAVERALAAPSGRVDARLAYTLTTASRILPRLLEECERIEPSLRLVPREMFASEIPGALLEERADIAMLPGQEPQTGLSSEPLLEEPIVLAVSDNHPLADRDRVNLGELAAETIQLWPRDMSPGYFDAVVGACRSAGFEPNVDDTAGGNPVWARIAEGSGIGLIATSQADSLRSGIRAVPLAAPVPTMEICLMLRADESDPSIESARRTILSAATALGSGHNI